MTAPTPYGSWPSPIDAETVAGDSLSFGGVAIQEETAYWLERRPDEEGRGVVCRETAAGDITAVTPPDIDVRTTVHEYGGGDFTVTTDAVIYSRFEDQRLYRTPLESEGDEAVALTPEPRAERAHRYADLEVIPDGTALYCVRERHEGGGEPVNELVRLSIEEGSEPVRVAGGHDFYAFPRVDPTGSYLAWTTWDHPRMPWDGTELHVADITPEGTLADHRTLMGGADESVFQPVWDQDGVLYAISDRTGWWNIYRLGEMSEPLEPRPILEDTAEYGTPQWAFGLATVVPLADGGLAAIRNSEGEEDMRILDPESGDEHSLGVPFSVYPHPRMATDGETIVTIAAGPSTPPSVVKIDTHGEATAVRRAFQLDLDEEYISEPRHISYPTGQDGSEEAYGFYYPPVNPDVNPPDDEKPPLLVKVHGGPTSQTQPVADLEIQYFTTRGFGVVDVNYRGSTGYGRDFRDRLDGEWGVVDTEDCIAAAEYLVSEGLVDPHRLAIRGGSAGGYAVLCALAFHDTFHAGASYYGVGDLRALAEHTHKFESRYLDGLVGPLPAAEGTYQDRSPTVHANSISSPLLVLQGGEDRVVPPAQAEDLVEALVTTGTPYAYFEFPEERQGFRTARAHRLALEAEFGFYASVFDVSPADDTRVLHLQRGEYRKRTPDSA